MPKAGHHCDKCGGSMFSEAAVSALGQTPEPELSCMNCGNVRQPAPLPLIPAHSEGPRRGPAPGPERNSGAV